MVSLLAWMAWGVCLAWITYHLVRKWQSFKSDVTAYEGNTPPEFQTVLFIEFILIGSGFLHIGLDEASLYPRTPAGFLHTGFSEAQLCFTAAWVIILLFVGRWFYLIAQNSDTSFRWNAGCFLSIIGLLTTSLFLYNVLGFPLKG